MTCKCEACNLGIVLGKRLAKDAEAGNPMMYQSVEALRKELPSLPVEEL
jgi:hypothetical protein